MQEPQYELFHEDVFSALRTCVGALGGPKAVGVSLWGESQTPDRQGDKLSNCLNPGHAQKLCLEEMIWILKAAHNAGCHAGINFICRDAGYSDPQPARDTEAEMARIADIYPFPDAREPKSSTQPATDSSDTPSPGSGSSHRADHTADDESLDVDEETQQASDPAGGGGGEDATQNTSKQEKSAADPEAAAPGDNSDGAAGQPPQDPESSGSDPGGAAHDEIDVVGLGSWVANHLKKTA